MRACLLSIFYSARSFVYTWRARKGRNPIISIFIVIATTLFLRDYMWLFQGCTTLYNQGIPPSPCMLLSLNGLEYIFQVVICNMVLAALGQ